MNRYHYIFISFLLVISCSHSSNRDFISFSDNGTSFKVEASDGKYVFQYYSPEILEVHFVPSGEELIDSSYAVIMGLSDEVIARATESDETIEIDSDGIDIIIQKNPFKVEYFRDGESIIKERAGYAVDSLETIEFQITRDEALYGAGSRALDGPPRL